MSFLDSAGGDLTGTLDTVQSGTDRLGVSASTFASAMTRAFTQASAGGKQLDDVLKQLALRLSNMAVAQAFKPLAQGVAGGIGQSIMNAVGGTGGGVTAFATGGVIATPSYFPLGGGLGLAGEAGPEAIMPLARGADGSLGVAVAGGRAAPNVTVQIATPDVGAFRRSEAYVTGQIARAVARGQRTM